MATRFIPKHDLTHPFRHLHFPLRALAFASLMILLSACEKEEEDDAALSSLECSSATLNGNLIQEEAASGVSVQVPYSGGNGGPHNGNTVESTEVIGLTATLSPGNVANGNGTLTYSITGTPSTCGNAVFALSLGGSSCELVLEVEANTICPDEVTFTYKGETVTYGVVVGANCTCWLDRNLGASQVATAINDSESFGDLFQWGRGDDGHQNRDSDTTSTLSSLDQPETSSFILAASLSAIDWRSPQNDNLWQGVNGINNPCPSGFRLPTMDEWTAERQVGIGNAADAFSSPLMLPASGFRESSVGNVSFATLGYYWSSSVSGTGVRYFYFDETTSILTVGLRGTGYAVRCIKD